MSRLTLAAATALTLIGGIATAGDDPVVVELYTSQGCSSCPPADALLGQLAGRDDVIALALHVDYWDYIGWKDQFADPANTLRQKRYAKAMGAPTIYTPQMVIGGRDQIVGSRPEDLALAIRRHRTVADAVDLQVTRTGSSVSIRARTMSRPQGAMAVQLVRFRPQASVAIERGENAGHTLTYHNIVQDWQTLNTWDGADPLALQIEVDGPAAIIVQIAGQGAIVAAQRVE